MSSNKTKTMNIKDSVNDKFMMGECSKFTAEMLKQGVDINTICRIVKEYQRKYLYVKSQDKEWAKHFTMKVWWINCVDKF